MIVVLPPACLFGYWGSSPFPWLMILSSKHKDNKALIAHEQVHQEQQRKDGCLTFWYRYLFKKQYRQQYEVEAYKVWIKVDPASVYSCTTSLANNYKLDITYKEAAMLLLGEPT